MYQIKFYNLIKIKCVSFLIHYFCSFAPALYKVVLGEFFPNAFIEGKLCKIVDLQFMQHDNNICQCKNIKHVP